MNRRTFLKLSAGAGAAALISAFRLSRGGLSVHQSAASHSAHAQGFKLVDSFTHKGSRIEFVANSKDEIMMRLDGRSLPHHAFGSVGKLGYASHLLPFEDYKSARTLARALVDNNGRLFIL